MVGAGTVERNNRRPEESLFYLLSFELGRLVESLFL